MKACHSGLLRFHAIKEKDINNRYGSTNLARQTTKQSGGLILGASGRYLLWRFSTGSCICGIVPLWSECRLPTIWRNFRPAFRTGMYSTQNYPKIVPWSCWEEWDEVHAWLYSDSDAHRGLAVKRVQSSRKVEAKSICNCANRNLSEFRLLRGRPDAAFPYR